MLRKQAMLLCVLLPALLAPAGSWAQDPPEVAKNKETAVKWYAAMGYEYSDNIFHLSPSQQTSLEENEQANVDSRRYADMNAVSDSIFSPAIGFRYKARSPLGGDLKLKARSTYYFHLENEKQNYPEATLSLENTAGKKGVLCLEGTFLLDYFKKNYLSDVRDENENGNITKAERIYAAARYDEYETEISYNHELLDNKKAPLSEVDIRPFLGYSRRSYNALFSNRDRKISLGGLELALEFFSRVDLEVTYTYEDVRSPNRSELVLFDETLDDADVNGDGEIKKHAPLVTRIDRSCRRHTVEISPSLKLSRDIRLFGEYKMRTADYRSDNPLDRDHYGQTGSREKIGFGLEYDFAKSWSAETEYRHIDEEDEEDDDYIENIFSVSVKHTF